jgi:hypothetical protein
MLAGLESNQRRTMIQRHVAPADRATGHQSLLPDLTRQPSRYRRAALPVAPRRHSCAREELNLHGPCRPRGPQPRASTVSPRTHRASDPDRTGCLLLTRETLCQMSYRGLAAGQGFEPRSRGSGPRILPLDDPASSAEGGSRTRTGFASHQGLGLARLPVTPLPPCAPRGQRSPTASPPRRTRTCHPRIKSPLL